MPRYSAIDDFLIDSESSPIIDVRAPIEFNQGHIPGAFNVPLFDDQERKEIGTLYKTDGRQASVVRGLEIVGPKMAALANSILDLCQEKRHIRIHCWRGGMRSRSFAWLMEQVDLEPTVLQGGYKAFRRHVLESFKRPLGLLVVSGLTGAGKTKQLKLLADCGQQVIDLERLANHRGSAFGGIGQGSQPSVEHFENELYHLIESLDPNRPIWVEDESRNVGAIKLPHHFFHQLRKAPAIFMDVDRGIRNRLIMEDYGELPVEHLQSAVKRISKRMGGQNVKQCLDLMAENRLPECVDMLLAYYDKNYLDNKSKMNRQHFVDFPTEDPVSISTTQKLISISESLQVSANTGI